MDTDKIVVYQTFSDPIDANIVKGLLDAHGIKCYLSDENIVTLNPLYSNAVEELSSIFLKQTLTGFLHFLTQKTILQYKLSRLKPKKEK